MSDAFWIALPGTIGALGALYMGIRNSQRIEHTGGQVVELKKQVDGQTTDLINTKQALATAAANLIAEDKARVVAIEVAKAVEVAKKPR